MVPTANERKALWFLAFVALSGSGVRFWRSYAPPADTPDSAALARQIGRVDSARSVRHNRPSASAKPKAPRAPAIVEAAASGRDERAAVDLDRAAVAEIEALPGIGPALAKRIVAHRDSAGPFDTIEALCGVRGVGRGLAERLRPLVTFTSTRRPLSDACGDASKKARKTRAGRSREPR